MIRDLDLTVRADEAGLRLDRFLAARLPDLSRQPIAEAVRHDEVRVNGRPFPKGGRLTAGDIVLVGRLRQSCDRAVLPNPELRLEVVFDDAWLVGVNKPAGMAVHPLDPAETGTVANGLVHRFPETAAIGDNPLFPALVHRIDGDTSGIVLAARTAAAYVHLRGQFRRREVTKVYTALVHGHVHSRRVMDADLTHQSSKPARMRLATDEDRRRGRRVFHAVSDWSPKRQIGPFTLLEVVIRTGVTHRIRCHLAAAGHPIVGDKTYGMPADGDCGLARHFLHATSLSFTHPEQGTPLTLSAPLPDDLRAFLDRIRSA